MAFHILQEKKNIRTELGQGSVQPKFEIRHPDDEYEQEAAAIAADRVKMTPGPPVSDQLMSGNTGTPALQMKLAMEAPDLQMKCEECEEEEKIRMKSEVQQKTMAGTDDEDNEEDEDE